MQKGSDFLARAENIVGGLLEFENFLAAEKLKWTKAEILVGEFSLTGQKNFIGGVLQNLALSRKAGYEIIFSLKKGGLIRS